jgi:hypothetical protein
MGWTRLTLSLLGSSVTNPAIGVSLARVAWRFRRRGWYKRFPFLPFPAADYVRWRMHTAYGSDGAVPPASDVIRYARWATRAP